MNKKLYYCFIISTLYPNSVNIENSNIHFNHINEQQKDRTSKQTKTSKEKYWTSTTKGITIGVCLSVSAYTLFSLLKNTPNNNNNPTYNTNTDTTTNTNTSQTQQTPSVINQIQIPQDQLQEIYKKISSISLTCRVCDILITLSTQHGITSIPSTLHNLTVEGYSDLRSVLNPNLPFNILFNNTINSNTSKNIGLSNTGNSCYCNSSIQCLVNTLHFTSSNQALTSLLTYVPTYPFSQNTSCQYTHPSNTTNTQSSDSLTTTLAFIDFLRAYECQRLYGINYNSKDLTHYISRLRDTLSNPDFHSRNTEQHDAQEFISSIINSLIPEFASLYTLPNIAVYSCQNPHTNISIPLPHISTKQTHHTTLPLSIQDTSSANIQDMLSAYLSPSVLDQENAYKCDICDELVPAIRTEHLLTPLPSILILQIKRFKYTQVNNNYYDSVKNNTNVSYPNVLTINAADPYMINMIDLDTDTNTEAISTKTYYQLAGIIYHTGSMRGGHYVASCMKSNAQTTSDTTTSDTASWSHYNDTITGNLPNTPSNDKDAPQGNAYILFYTRKN